MKRHSLVKLVAIVFFVVISTELFLQLVSVVRYVRERAKISHRIMSVFRESWYFTEGHNTWWQDENRNVSAFYQPFVGWQYASQQTSHIHRDENGIRLTVGNPGATEGAKQIYFFGGSAMEGYYVADEETIPSYMTKLLRDTQTKYVVTNYARLGFNSTQELIYLITLLKKGARPEHVVFYDGHNEVTPYWLYATPTQTYYEDVMRKTLGNIWTLGNGSNVENKSLFSGEMLRQLSERVKLIHYPLQAYKNLTHTVVKETNSRPYENVLTDAEIAEYAEAIVKNYSGNAEVLESLSKHYGFSYLLLWQPNAYTKPLTQKERYDPVALRADYTKLYKTATKTVSLVALPHFHDLSDVFSELKDTSVFIDIVHISPEGNAMVAKRILECMKEEFLIPE